ncbi:MAG: FeoB-associated Cys-rich membrane protein [Clostridia bacterium]|nr:FeoB-associated Cys-rich membrane protein [Clostridia bacterium]
MFQGIIDHAGTILVSLVLLLLVARIIFVLRRDRKQGKSTCGCNCGSCPMSGSCHKQS